MIVAMVREERHAGEVLRDLGIGPAKTVGDVRHQRRLLVAGGAGALVSLAAAHSGARQDRVADFLGRAGFHRFEYASRDGQPVQTLTRYRSPVKKWSAAAEHEMEAAGPAVARVRAAHRGNRRRVA